MPGKTEGPRPAGGVGYWVLRKMWVGAFRKRAGEVGLSQINVAEQVNKKPVSI